MSHQFITIEQAAERAGKAGNSKRAVIPKLIAKGLLEGRVEQGKQLVADDERLARVLQLGVESFVMNRQGFSFVVVRAPIETVERVLRGRPAVSAYEAKVQPLLMKASLGVQPDHKFRKMFLVQLKVTPAWSVLIQTVHWFEACDSVMGAALASMLSRECGTFAAAAWDDDFSGNSLILCENGSQKQNISDHDSKEGWTAFYQFFYEQGIFLPEAFIGTEGDSASFHVADPAEVQRVDHAVLRIPSQFTSPAPHVFEKLAMMVEAVAKDIPDEQTFMAHRQSGVWEQGQKLLASGEI